MERSRPGAATLLVCGVLLQGCVGAQAGDEPVDAKTGRVEARGTSSKPLPERIPAPRAPVMGEAPADLVAQVREDATRRSGADPSAVRLIRDEAVTWSDGSLGCPRPGEFYTQAPVPGYWIVFDVAGRNFDYRSDGRGNFRLCESLRAAPPSAS